MDRATVSNVRVQNFDFLRGAFVYLALCQHFAAYLNGWYVWHFDDLGTSPITLFHSQFANTRLSTDPIGVSLLWFFTPWVSHIYLALAAFNLAKRARTDFITVYRLKLFGYTALFFFFFLENAVVSQSIGEMFSFYPLMAWMIILAVLAVIYRYGGIGGVFVFYCLGLFQSVSGINLICDQFEVAMRANFHSAFEYDARVHYYMHSAGLGFLVGYLHFQKRFFERYQNVLYAFFIATVFFIIWFLTGTDFIVPPSEVLRHEHMYNLSFSGTCFVQAIQILVLSLFLYAHNCGLHVPRNMFHWIGIHSLLVFGFHRIFFLFIIGPFRELLGGYFEIPMSSHCIEVFTFAFISIALSYLLIKSKIPNLIIQQSNNSK